MANTTITLLTEDASTALAAQAAGDALWLAAPELTRATGVAPLMAVCAESVLPTL